MCVKETQSEFRACVPPRGPTIWFVALSVVLTFLRDKAKSIMNAHTVQCPGCGQSSSGKFCNHCGTPLTAEAHAPWNAQRIVSWAALGIASLALVIALMAMFKGDSSEVALPPFVSPWSSAAPATGQPPDLSSMTPREAADRLFNRVMTASENGNTAEALRFAPMALQAYGKLPGLDNDARYHVALLHLTSGDAQSARTQIELMRKSVRNHLLAFMLEHQIAELGSKLDIAAQASRGFLAAYPAEIVAGRPEYHDHQNTIESFRKAAQAGAGGKK